MDGPDLSCVRLGHLCHGGRTVGAILDTLEVVLEHADVFSIIPLTEHASIVDSKDTVGLEDYWGGFGNSDQLLHA